MNERHAIHTAQGEEKQMCYARPVHIGKDCWFGASVTICPDVTIGDGCVIGVGAVVTRDIILPESSSSCPALHSHTPQTTFALHLDHALHGIHQTHYNKKFGLHI